LAINGRGMRCWGSLAFDFLLLNDAFPNGHFALDALAHLRWR
jgi:hypothetical protein